MSNVKHRIAGRNIVSRNYSKYIKKQIKKPKEWSVIGDYWTCSTTRLVVSQVCPFSSGSCSITEVIEQLYYFFSNIWIYAFNEFGE
jgi:hypothetical protein